MLCASLQQFLEKNKGSIVLEFPIYPNRHPIILLDKKRISLSSTQLIILGGLPVNIAEFLYCSNEEKDE
jgi:hypothetical protein